MNSTDRIIDDIQREVELDGRSHADCVYLNDFSFTIERHEYEVPTNADVRGAELDVAWFFASAKKRQQVAHPEPDRSFWFRIFGKDANGYGHSWNIPVLLEHLKSPEAWRRAVLFNPCVSLDPPCVLTYQFHKESSNLHLTVSMRSSDVYNVLPQDICMTDLILKRIAGYANLQPGRMTFNLGNAHAYYEDMEFIEEFVLDWGD